MAQLHDRRESEEPADEPDARMGFLDHLDELRARLIKSCIALGAGMGSPSSLSTGSPSSCWRRRLGSFRPAPS